jgi:hypothetical protein
VASGPQCYLQPGSPPSSYAVAAVLEGEPGGWGKVAIGTAQRAMFIVPGIAIAGGRGKTLWLGAVLGSVGITLMLFAFYGAQRRGLVADWAQNRQDAGG